jgi:hypothetical protein
LENDQWYSALGFECIHLHAGDGDSAEEAFGRLSFAVLGTSRRILIDVSSMTRAWYGGIFRALRAWEASGEFTTCFLYAPAKFTRPRQEYPQNEYVTPVPGFAGLALPDAPTALIVGVGHDCGRALGVYQELDPAIVASFLARPGGSREFERSAEAANQDFLRLVEPQFQFDYPLMDFNTSFQRLHAVCRWLRDTAAVVIAPLGPKVFALCSFLVALDDPGVSVWRISAGEREGAPDRPAAGPILAVTIDWNNNRVSTFDEAGAFASLAGM